MGLFPPPTAHQPRLPEDKIKSIHNREHLVPKKAARTAAGLTGLLGYFIGDLLANAALSRLIDKQGMGC